MNDLRVDWGGVSVGAIWGSFLIWGCKGNGFWR